MLKYFLYFCFSVFFFFVSCTHDPFEIDTTIVEPTDTTMTTMDTMLTGNPCDPDTVYFEKDILPILVSNCTKSGCHDVASAQDGVILNNYNNVINSGKVEAYDLDGSDLYEAITENDPDKQMPPPGEVQLSNEAISLIAQWINQGAQDLKCEETNSACDLSAVSFSTDIEPVIMSNCLSCHSGGYPSGGFTLSGYEDISSLALSGRLYGAVSWQQGFVRMPFGGQQLNQCFIDKLNVWINDGAQDN